eukprot:scaffold206312_cov35-Tisochrysis_lutea.AAC.1
MNGNTLQRQQRKLRAVQFIGSCWEGRWRLKLYGEGFRGMRSAAGHRTGHLHSTVNRVFREVSLIGAFWTRKRHPKLCGRELRGMRPVALDSGHLLAG